MEFKRVIEVTKETRDFLQKAFDVTGTMVWYALNFDEKRGQSDLAKRIRSWKSHTNLTHPGKVF